MIVSKLIIFTSLITMAVCGSCNAVAEQNIEILQDRSIHFRRGVIHPEQVKDTLNISQVFTVSRRHMLMQFGHIPSPEEQSELAVKGITLLKYIPNFTYWVSIDPNVKAPTEEINTAGGIQWIWIPTIKYKMSEAIDKNEFPPNAKYEDGTVRVKVLIFEDVIKEEAIDSINSLSNEVQVLNWITNRTLAVRTPLEFIQNIASLDQVEWVEPAEPPNIPTNATLHKGLKWSRKVSCIESGWKRYNSRNMG